MRFDWLQAGAIAADYDDIVKLLRWIRLVTGCALVPIGVCGIVYCVLDRHEYLETTGANSIQVPVDHPLVQAGSVTLLLYGAASVILVSPSKRGLTSTSTFGSHSPHPHNKARGNQR